MEAHSLGYQLAIHANGDAAVEMAIDTIEFLLSKVPRADHRHRIEHCQVVTPDQLERIAKLGIFCNFFVSHTHFWGDLYRQQTLGPKRAAFISPLAAAKALGIPFSLHSDAPVTDPGPLAIMTYATTRLTRSGFCLGPDQRVSALDALRAITLDAARFAFEEMWKGSIEPGKFADITVLSDDPLSVPPEKICDIRVIGVILGGRFFPAASDAASTPTNSGFGGAAAGVAAVDDDDGHAFSFSSSSSSSSSAKRQRT